MRKMIVAGGQLGPITRDESKKSAVARMVALMKEAASRGAQLIVFPELALTTFFPRWWVSNKADFDHMFEKDMPNKDVSPVKQRRRILYADIWTNFPDFESGWCNAALEDRRVVLGRQGGEEGWSIYL